ncbi:hypothetical protein JMM63_14295 [Rhodovulum sulfidophilum]|uniref:hypothetical protein n=1 Tax=Rhodovulum sulfidophilum TaxID=35806 RepID=UPI0019214284|nr:hypothetical protein [Rhodovulum sulfidophilum]MBL3596720.1 hypothetical protein [Rhodovulum sulfidophilum]
MTPSEAWAICVMRRRTSSRADQLRGTCNVRRRQGYSYYETHRETASLARRSLANCLPSAKALFDADLEQAIGELMKQFDIVFADVGWRAELSPDEHQAKWKKLTPGGPSEDSNKMDATIAAQVARIEDICLPQLRAAGRKRRDDRPSV